MNHVPHIKAAVSARITAVLLESCGLKFMLKERRDHITAYNIQKHTAKKGDVRPRRRIAKLAIDQAPHLRPQARSQSQGKRNRRAQEGRGKGVDDVAAIVK